MTPPSLIRDACSEQRLDCGALIFEPGVNRLTIWLIWKCAGQRKTSASPSSSSLARQIVRVSRMDACSTRTDMPCHVEYIHYQGRIYVAPSQLNVLGVECWYD